MTRETAVRYVVADTVPASVTGAKPLVLYWAGPLYGFGTTSGALSDAAVFTSRAAAENALRSVYGTLTEAKRRGYRVVRDG